MARVYALIVALCLIALLSSPFGAYAHGRYRGLQRIAYANPYCESQGDPHNARNPKYRGKWQFDHWTWNRFAPRWLQWDGINGHRNDPAYVSEYWQDRVALRVTYDAWPHC